MISKTKFKVRLERKKNPALASTLVAAHDHEAWRKTALFMVRSKRKSVAKNLNEIEAATKEGDTIVIPGKVLGVGSVSKKIRVCALSFSHSAREKLRASKSETITILEEIRKNPKAEGIKILE